MDAQLRILAARVGVPDSKVVERAASLVRLAQVKMPLGLGQGEVCKASICLELACAELLRGQGPPQEKFIQYGCTTKKVYLTARGLLLNTLGVREAQLSLPQLAVVLGCEALVKPALALLALHRERFVTSVEAASPGGMSDFSRPVFMAAALHLTASSGALGRGKAKLDLRKLLRTLDVTTADFTRTVASIQQLCEPELTAALAAQGGAKPAAAAKQRKPKIKQDQLWAPAGNAADEAGREEEGGQSSPVMAETKGGATPAKRKQQQQQQESLEGRQPSDDATIPAAVSPEQGVGSGPADPSPRSQGAGAQEAAGIGAGVAMGGDSHVAIQLMGRSKGDPLASNASEGLKRPNKKARC